MSQLATSALKAAHRSEAGNNHPVQLLRIPSTFTSPQIGHNYGTDERVLLSINAYNLIVEKTLGK